MFITKNRIEEDLEIARRAMLEMPVERDAGPANITDREEALGLSDFLGLWGAAVWVIAPWAIAFATAIGVVGWLLTMWMGV